MAKQQHELIKREYAKQASDFGKPDLTPTLPQAAEAIRRELNRETEGTGETGMRPFSR